MPAAGAGAGRWWGGSMGSSEALRMRMLLTVQRLGAVLLSKLKARQPAAWHWCLLAPSETLRTRHPCLVAGAAGAAGAAAAMAATPTAATRSALAMGTLAVTALPRAAAAAGMALAGRSTTRPRTASESRRMDFEGCRGAAGSTGALSSALGVGVCSAERLLQQQCQRCATVAAGDALLGDACWAGPSCWPHS